MRCELLEIVEVSNSLGEAVLWDKRDNSIWWTDILERRLYCYSLDTGKLRHFPTPERVASFGLTERPGHFITAFESGFAYYTPATQSLQWLARPEHPYAGRRFNDGRVDPQGRFWAGTMVEDENLAGHDSAALYRLDMLTGVSLVDRNVQIANSLCWSPDGRIMYFADSPKREIYTYDFDPENGELGSKRIFAVTEEGVSPDGSVTDVAGYLWNAQWGAGRVRRYSPDGQPDFDLSLPVSQPTCVAFGGARLDYLIVTTARVGLSPKALASQPHAGHLFIFQTDVAGLPGSRYAGDPSG